jgi:hypothetical protein
MTWLAWRQFRTAAVVAGLVLVAVAMLLGSTGPHLAHIYREFNSIPGSSPDIGGLNNVLLLSTALVVVPAAIGAFWGAPMIARELEAGTYRLAWTQSVSRTRWLATKLGLLSLAAVAFTGLFTWMTVWWAHPMHRNRFSAGAFGQNGIAPMGYALFAAVLGVALGLLIRRTLPAMAATLAIFLTVRLVFTLWIREHFAAALRLTTTFGPPPAVPPVGSKPIIPGSPGDQIDPGAWIVSDHTVNSAGHVTNSIRCGPGDASSCFAGYHEVITYQPANRFWTFQLYETALFVGLAMLLVGFCFWWIRRRSA